MASLSFIILLLHFYFNTQLVLHSTIVKQEGLEIKLAYMRFEPTFHIIGNVSDMDAVFTNLATEYNKLSEFESRSELHFFSSISPLFFMIMM